MRHSIERISDRVPRPRRILYFNRVTSCKSIGKHPFAIASPDDPVNGLFLRKFQYDPARSRRIGHPTMRVSVLSVVGKTQFVSSENDSITRRRECRSKSGGRDICI